VTLLSAGLPFHRRASRRKLDTLLIVEGETRQKFHFGIAIDVGNSIAAAADYLTPLYSFLPDRNETPPAGWIFHLNCKNIVTTFSAPNFDELGKLSGTTLRLQETEGRGGDLVINAPFRLRSAWHVDLRGQLVRDLRIDGQTASCSFSPFQFFQVKLEW
jgi:hypothetical protein